MVQQNMFNTIYTEKEDSAFELYNIKCLWKNSTSIQEQGLPQEGRALAGDVGKGMGLHPVPSYSF